MIVRWITSCGSGFEGRTRYTARVPRKPLTVHRLWRRVRYEVLRRTGPRRRADILEVRLLEGWLSPGCCRLLYDTVRSLDVPGDVAEIGSWKGKSTVLLARAVQRSGQSRSVYAIDHFEGSAEHADVIRGEPDSSTWAAFQETIRAAGVEARVSPIPKPSHEAVRILAERRVSLAFAFVDGGHTEAETRANIHQLLPVMAPTGYLAFHDAKPAGHHPGVYRAIESVLGDLAHEVAWGGSIRLMRLKEGVRSQGSSCDFG